MWLTHDHFGSCTGCDYCKGDPSGWRDDVLGSAYCFENLEDLETYVRNTEAREFKTKWESLNREEVIEAAKSLQQDG